MRKPRDFDSALQTLTDKTKGIRGASAFRPHKPWGAKSSFNAIGIWKKLRRPPQKQEFYFPAAWTASIVIHLGSMFYLITKRVPRD